MAFAPWDTAHVPANLPYSVQEYLEPLPPEAWTRKHALLCAETETGMPCAGFERLAKDWAALDPSNHPDNKLRIPVFDPNVGPPTSPETWSLDKPPALSDADLDAKLQQAHEKLRGYYQRQTESHFTRLLVYIDGREQGHLQPEAPLLRLSGVSSGAISLAVYGEDTAGFVPLVLFDLYEAAEDEHGPSQMLAVLESGATLTLALVPHWDQEGELAAWDLDLQWTPAAAVQKDLAWCEAVLTATMQHLELARMLGQAALREELEARILPRWHEVYQVVGQTPGDVDWQGDLLARMEELCRREDEEDLAQLYRRTRETLRGGQESAQSAAAISLREDASPPGPRLVRWLSSLWRPPLAGVPVTAADIPVQERTFWLEDGEISLTCEWRAAYQQQPATLHLVWRATITRPGELWVRFTRPEDPTNPYTEVRLGSALAGEQVFTSAILGFDPTQEPWAVRLLLKESQV
jgi:hypothetical protein